MRCHGNRWTSRQFSGVCMCFCRGAASSPHTLAGVQSPPWAQVGGPAQHCLLDSMPTPPSPRCSPAGTMLIPEPPGMVHWGWQGRVPCTWVLPCVDTGAGELCPVGWAGTGIPLPGCAVPRGSPLFPEGGQGALGCAPWEPIVPRGRARSAGLCRDRDPQPPAETTACWTQGGQTARESLCRE